MTSNTLREEVALLVEGYQWDSGQSETEARDIASAILAIPTIRDALARLEQEKGLDVPWVPLDEMPKLQRERNADMRDTLACLKLGHSTDCTPE